MYKVYGATFCGFCGQAKALLEDKGVEFTYVDIQGGDGVKEWRPLAEANGFRSIPQIFKDDVHIGGFNELKAELES